MISAHPATLAGQLFVWPRGPGCCQNVCFSPGSPTGAPVLQSLLGPPGLCCPVHCVSGPDCPLPCQGHSEQQLAVLKATSLQEARNQIPAKGHICNNRREMRVTANTKTPGEICGGEGEADAFVQGTEGVISQQH